MKTCADYKITDDAIKTMQIVSSVTFPPEPEFNALLKAKKFLREENYSIGTQQGDAPIGILLNQLGYAYEIAKWRNLSNREKQGLNGVIVPYSEYGGFRDGGAMVIFFYKTKISNHDIIALVNDGMPPSEFKDYQRRLANS